MEPAGTSKSGKKRVRNFTSDDRAAHRIFERSRREAFKEKLNKLAGHLPALADSDPQRLSKHIVVEEAIARCQNLHGQCLDALSDIRALIQERDELLTEVNARRHVEGAPLRVPKAVDLHVEGLAALEKETEHPAAVRQPGPSLLQGRSPEEGTDGQEISTITTRDPASAPTLSVPPLPVSEAGGDALLFWNLANGDSLPDALLNPQTPGTLPSAGVMSASQPANPRPLPMSYNASLNFLDVEDPLAHQDFVFYDTGTASIFPLGGHDFEVGTPLPPVRLSENDLSQLGLGSTV